MSATKPDDPAETPSARTFEQRPVAPDAQGRSSPGATEPGDIGAGRDEARPKGEHPRAGEGQCYRGG